MMYVIFQRNTCVEPRFRADLVYSEIISPRETFQMMSRIQHCPGVAGSGSHIVETASSNDIIPTGLECGALFYLIQASRS